MFRNSSIRSCKIFLSSRIRQAVLKKAKVKLELLTDTDMQLMSEKGVRGGICHSFNRYATANNQYMKIIIKVKNRHILNIGM